MAVINADWAVRNSTRKYPLDDTASTVSDDGRFLPTSFLVDCNIWAPKLTFASGRTLQYLYLGAASVTENQVSMSLLGTAGAVRPANGEAPGVMEPEFVPLATVSVAKSDLVPYRNYAITPLTAGVSGWVAFGQLYDSEPFGLLFSTPQQAMLTPRVARFYSGLPTPGITVGALRKLLVGDVAMVAGEPIQTKITTRYVEGFGTREVIEVYMGTADGKVPDKETLESFNGKCYPRPESETCTRKPIKRISGVSPDENNRIFLEFQGVNVRRFQDGICIDSEHGLADSCAGAAVEEADPVCQAQIPYVNTFDTLGAFKVSSGYFYTDSGNLYAFAGGFQCAAASTCIKTAPVSGVRAFTLAVSKHDDPTKVGQFFCANQSHRVVVTLAGNVYGEDVLGDTRVYLGSVAMGNPMTVLVTPDHKISGVHILDKYWNPDGEAGIIAYGESEMVFTQYGVTDV